MDQLILAVNLVWKHFLCHFNCVAVEMESVQVKMMIFMTFVRFSVLIKFPAAQSLVHELQTSSTL